MLTQNIKAIMDHCVYSRRFASSKAKNKVSMKEQMNVPTAEELVKINEDMRKSMREGKKVKNGMGADGKKIPSAGRIFLLAVVGGILYGLLQQYTFSGQGPPKATSLDAASNIKMKDEEITIIKRQTNS